MRSLLVIIAVSFLSVACGKVPSSYIGGFADPEKGATLKIEQNDWTFSGGGRSLVSKSQDLKFEEIVQGKAGVYIQKNSLNDKILEVYWMNPNLASRFDGAGKVFFTGELIYTQLSSEAKDKVNEINLFHCATGGQLELDTATQRILMGCPAGPTTYRMLRKE
jgi:hypothetical protein